MCMYNVNVCILQHACIYAPEGTHTLHVYSLPFSFENGRKSKFARAGFANYMCMYCELT